MSNDLTLRDEVLVVLDGGHVERVLCFSGLINVTQPGLDGIGLTLPAVHTDPHRMARAASTTHRLSGFASAVVPLDMCVEAELLGATVDYDIDGDGSRLPQPVAPLTASTQGWTFDLPSDVEARARVATVIEAIQLLKAEHREDLAVGAWVPGPFTLASLLIDVGNLLMETRTAPESVGRVLDDLTDLLVAVARAYQGAGADFITVHEMGGSPGFIGPPAFEGLVLPRLQRMFEALSPPRILHVCGETNSAIAALAAAGSEAVSVDQLNDLAQSRATLGDRAPVLLGNIDPVAVISEGSADDVRQAVSRAIADGVDAVWPGCDLLPLVPDENLTALVEESHRARPRSHHPGG